MAPTLQSSTELLTNPAALAQYWKDREAATAAAAAAAEATRNRTFGEVAGDFGTQLLQGAVGLGQAAYGVGNMATLGFLDRATGMSKNFNETNQILNSWKSAPTQAALAQSSAAFDDGIGAGVKNAITDPRVLQDLLVTNLPSMIPAGAGAQFAIRGKQGLDVAKYAARGAARAGAAQAGGAADIDTINAAKEAGMTDGEAQAAGLGAGIVTGAMTPVVSRLTGAAHLEGLVAAKMLGHKNPIAAAGQTVVKNVLGGIAKEGGEETIQSSAETAIQNAFTGKDITNGVAQSAALGAIAGGALGGGMGAFAGPRASTQQRADINNALAESAAAAGATAAPSALATPSGQGMLFPDVGGPAIPTGALPAEEQQAAAAAAAAEQKVARDAELRWQIVRTNALLSDPTLTPQVHYALRNDLAVAQQELAALRIPASALNQMTSSPQGQLGLHIPLNDTIGVQEGEMEHIEIKPPEAYDPLATSGERLDLLGDPMYYSEFAKEQQAAGNAPVSPNQWVPPGALPAAEMDQRPLFGVQPMNFGQSMQARKAGKAEATAAQQLEATMRANAAVDAVRATVGNTVPIQQAIDERMQAQRAGIAEKDLLSIEDIVRERMFTTNEDGTITKWNPDLQRQEVVTPAQADAEVKAATSWKEFMVKQLGVKPNDLQGKAWKAFNDAANESGVLPVSGEAADFLNAYANTIDPSADLPKFALKFHEKFGAQPEAAPEAQPAAAPAPVEPAPVPADMSIAGQAASAAAAPKAEQATGPEFKMARQDGQDHTVTSEGTTVTFRKNLDASEGTMATWEYVDPQTGFTTSFSAPSRADAKAHMTQVVEDMNKGAAAATDGHTKLFDKGAFDSAVSAATKTGKKFDGLMSVIDDTFDSLSDEDALDEAYIHVKSTPEYQALTDKQRKLVRESYELAYEEINGAKYARAGTGTAPLHEGGLPVNHMERIQQTVDFANNNRTEREAPVQLFKTVADFKQSRPLDPNGNEVKVPADAKGIYLDDGTVALIAENLQDDKDAARTLIHERTHEGLAGLLGDSLAAVTNRLWANPAMRKLMKEKQEKFGLDRATAAEEVITDLQESNKRLTGDVFSKIKSGITKAFDVLLGSNEIQVSNADVDALLNDVVQYRSKGITTPASRMTQADAMKHVDAMIGGVPDRLVTARFSRAIDSLREITGEGTDEPVGSPSSVIGGAVKDVYTTVSGMMQSLAKGNFGSLPRELYRAAGVGTMHSHFGNLWIDTDEAGNKTNAYDDYFQARTDHADERKKMVYSVEKVSNGFENMRKTNPEKLRKVSAMIQNSTFFQLFPGASPEDQPVNTKFDPVERENARTLLDSLWKQVGKEGQQLYSDLQNGYKRLFTERYTALKNNFADTKGIDLETADKATLSAFAKEFGDLLDNALHTITKGPYSPLKRFGNFMVDIRDGNGKQVEFTGHDTEAEALKFAADQRARFGSSYKVSTFVRSEFKLEIDGVDPKYLDRIQKGVEARYPVVDIDPTLPPAEQARLADRNAHNREMQLTTRDTLVDAYLHVLPRHSVMQAANARKYVEGFPLDASRAFHSHTLGMADSIANIKYNGAISESLSRMESFVRKVGMGNDEGIKMGNILNAVRGQYAGSKSEGSNKIATALTTASFVNFMVSPSQLFMNGLQTPLVAAPRMAAEFGTPRAMRALGAAAKMFFSKGGVLNNASNHPQVTKVLNTLHEAGMDDYTLTSTMSGIAAGNDSDAHGLFRTVMKAVAYPMHKSEVFNRQITSHAYATMLVEQAEKAGKTISDDELLRKTRNFIDNESHFNYDPQNSPEMMQGPWKRAIWQFQNYRLQMLALLAKDLKNAEISKVFGEAVNPEQAALARKTLAYTLVTQLGLTGAAGTTISPIVFAIMDAFKDDDDLLDARTEAIQGMGTVAAHGLLGSLGIDPSRIEAGSVLPWLGDRQYAPKDKTGAEEFTYMAMKAAGPSVGMMKNWWDGAGHVWQGDFGEAAKKLLPKGASDIFTATQSYDGVRDSRGTMYYDPTAGDTVMQALGLKSMSRSEADAKRGAAFQAEAHVKALTKRALTQVALGINLGDDELQQAGTERFYDLMQKHPELVKASQLKRTIVGVNKAQYNADTYGIPQAGRLSQELLEAVGE